jgi:YidC/Oxa1 family membrane protein insertase
MDDRQRFRLFLLLSAVVLAINFMFLRWAPPPKGAGKQPAAERADADKPDANATRDGVVDEEKTDSNEASSDVVIEREKAPKAEAAPVKEVAEEWNTLGSLDERDGYRMLVTFTNRGAAIERIELNSERFHDLDDRSAYLGNLALVDQPNGLGARVRVVGPGTPAAAAGLQPGDVIAGFGEPATAVTSADDLLAILEKSKPGETVKLSILRDSNVLQLAATLRRRPLELIKPEADDPLSFLLTLQKIDGQEIGKKESEIPGLTMRTGNWTRRPGDPDHPDEVAFDWFLPEHDLQVAKIYRLAKVPADAQSDRKHPNVPAYHLDFGIEIRNLGEKTRQVAYRLDGPTGLPTEGWWYASSSKISPHWSGVGLRDVVVGIDDDRSFQNFIVSPTSIAEEKANTAFADEDRKFVFVGVDAQYFSSILIPRDDEGNMPVAFSSVKPLAVGKVPDDAAKKKLLDVSCRIDSLPFDLRPDGKPAIQRFQIFAGPKRPPLLESYAKTDVNSRGLGPIIYYGWFGWVSVPMLAILHFFYGIVGNFGLAIVMLTVLVRSCMFPLSRKQALGAAKMQELQPELKKITEKYKNNATERTKAQQELFRKHNYHPLSGCLPALIQLPIFLGLYRSLAVDIELRQAPLLSEAIRWCSNLAAPDMLWRWDGILFSFLAGETGWLGPYLNVLPLVTISLFLWQQKMFLPPPADEQAAMQQKIMQYMMIFMGVMFFKVPSGLCLYFIASSLWGICERKLLPKTLGKSAPPPAAPAGARPSAPTPNGNGSAARGKKKARRER